MLSASSQPGRQSFDLDADGVIDIADLYWLQENPADIDGNGTADTGDIKYLEAWLRNGERHDMLHDRR